jgi:hypothetical protein
MQAIVDDNVERSALEILPQAIMALDQLIVFVQLGSVPFESAASLEHARVLLEVTEVDVEADHASVGEQVAPDREAGALKDAELGNGQVSGSKDNGHTSVRIRDVMQYTDLTNGRHHCSSSRRLIAERLSTKELLAFLRRRICLLNCKPRFC